MRAFSLLTVAVLLSNCAYGSHFISSYQPDDSFIMHSYSDDLQNAFLKTRPSQTKLCLEPSPDVALSSGGGLNAATPLGDSIGLTETSKATSLGGRSDMTLVTRELMYRACELSLNTNASPAETISIYETFLSTLNDVTANIAKAQSAHQQSDDDDDDSDDSSSDSDSDDSSSTSN